MGVGEGWVVDVLVEIKANSAQLSLSFSWGVTWKLFVITILLNKVSNVNACINRTYQSYVTTNS